MASAGSLQDTAASPPPACPDGTESAARDRAFPRSARLADARAYDVVFSDNRRLADRYWTVLVHHDSDNTQPREARLGLAIAKKRARRAVDRNRLKRVARESFRTIRRELDGRHVVVMNRDAASTASSSELRTALDALWTRLLRQSRTGREGR